MLRYELKRHSINDNDNDNKHEQWMIHNKYILNIYSIEFEKSTFDHENSNLDDSWKMV